MNLKVKNSLTESLKYKCKVKEDQEQPKIKVLNKKKKRMFDKTDLEFFETACDLRRVYYDSWQ